jgi:hypothetical protein
MRKRWGTKRRIMRSFKMNEISGVDRPAQIGASVLMTKRDDSDPIETFAKASFQEALDEQTLEQRFNRAFYDAFENIYTVNDALKTALKDRYQNSEETLRSYLAAVAELATKAIAATSGLAKSDSLDADVIKAAIVAALEEAQGEATMNKTQLAAAIAKFQKDGGTQAEIDAILAAAKALGAEDTLPATGALAKNDQAAQLAALQARLDKADKVSALGVEARKHYDGLDAAGQDSFLALDAAGQADALTKGQGDDPVLYKSNDGTEIRKSDGPAALALAKKIDGLMGRVAKAEAIAGDADLRKRAGDTLSKLAGTTDVHVALLKAVDGIADEAVRTAVMATLKSANSAAGGAYKRLGTQAGGGEPLGKGADDETLSGPDAQLEKLARDAMAKAEESGQEAFFKHYAAVLETDEGKRLYQESVAQAAG